MFKYLVKATILVSIALTFFGCSYNNVNRIDFTDEDKDKEEAFIGIADVYTSNQVSTVNIVFVHGMGIHPFGEESTSLYQDTLAEKLGFSVVEDEKDIGWKKCIKGLDVPCVPLMLNKVEAGYLGWRKFQRKDGKNLNLFELSWDKTTELIQKQILELDGNYYENKEGTDDKEYDREKDRAIINKQMKKFINSSFADPAIYLGYFGEEIRKVVASGLLQISDIALKSSNKLKPNLDNQIVLISDSLGSAIVFETVDEIRKGSKMSINKIEQFASHTTHIYMNANQLPLIQLGRIKGPKPNETTKEWLNNYPCHGESSGLSGFSKAREEVINKNKLPYPMLEIVAFSDPNDALTYHLTKRFKKNCSDNKVRIINATLTNAHWNWLLVFANPYKAHAEGFKTNEKAIDLIINGNNYYRNH